MMGSLYAVLLGLQSVCVVCVDYLIQTQSFWFQSRTEKLNKSRISMCLIRISGQTLCYLNIRGF